LIWEPLIQLESSRWISPDSIKKHLASTQHCQAIGHSADVQRQQDVVETVNREQELEFMEL
jgi:hypothetical protein